ncbi:MAG: ferrous iron transport protein B [Oligoflexia bacterium]|nr:ferrous iron transport protein B [Oligoflexia bacterium]
MTTIALAGNPNCGKTVLFNMLTGSRQKVGNYPGVTVEKKEGPAKCPSGRTVNILDLPGTCSLNARTPDEEITRKVLLGQQKDVPIPDALIAVVDATNLERNLGLVLELRELGLPMVLAVNMMDLADRRGLELDLKELSRKLGVPVVPSVAVKKKGISEILAKIEELLASEKQCRPAALAEPTAEKVRARFAEVDAILRAATHKRSRPTEWTDRIDRIVLHPVWGTLLLIVVLSLMFQAIFSWANMPQDWIKAGISRLAAAVGQLLGEGPLKSLITNGVIAGVGAVLVFLPQILLLFLFILFLEDSGYMARAAFLMDKLMGKVGLHGRAFIPLLSSHACAIPGIMATRTIENRRDRLTTILVAPLTTCSARLPVYTLLISAFIPNRVLFGPIRLQGIVMFGLYAAGLISALIMAMVFRATLLKGKKPPLLLELPTYKWPSFRSILLGLWERCSLFLHRAGTVILTLSVILWFLVSYPKPPANLPTDPAHPPISYSFAGKIGQTLEPLVRPLGFDWRIAVALIPGFAAREVMISALGTVYAVEGDHSQTNANEEGATEALAYKLAKSWSLATALSLLVWYILACQCLSTLAVTRRETNSWRWPALMLGYMTALAYAGSFLTFHFASWLGWG